MHRRVRTERLQMKDRASLMNGLAANRQSTTKARPTGRRTSTEGSMRKMWCNGSGLIGLLATMVAGLFAAGSADAQSFRVQCPTSTITHPTAANNNAEPAYAGPTYPAPATPPTSPTTYTTGATGPVNGAIKCQQISGGDGYATMGDGTQTYLFSFGPLSGLADIARGLPGTQFPSNFNAIFPGASSGAFPVPGDPATTDINGGNPNTSDVNLGLFTWNGAVGLASDVQHNFTIYDISDVVTGSAPNFTHTVTVVLNQPSPFQVGDTVIISQGPVGTDLNGYVNSPNGQSVTVTAINAAAAAVTPTGFPASYGFQYTFTSSNGKIG